MDALLEKHRQALAAKRSTEGRLLRVAKERLPELEKLLSEVEGHWRMEDGFYRFYHGSFKVYGLQSSTDLLVKTIQSLLPDVPLNETFLAIVKEGTGKEFELEHNQEWEKHTRPMLEAFFHAHYFLKLICQFARTLESPPQPMPSGWAAVLYLYNLR